MTFALNLLAYLLPVAAIVALMDYLLGGWG